MKTFNTDGPAHGEVNPVLVACAHAGYEAARAFRGFLQEEEIPAFGDLKGQDRQDVIDAVYITLSADGTPSKLSEHFGDPPFEKMLPDHQLKYQLFVNGVASAYKAITRLASAKEEMLEEIERRKKDPEGGVS